MDEYKVKQLRQMLAHETDSGEHFGAWLSHWYGDTRTLTIDVGGLKVLTATVPEADADRLRKMGDFLRDKDPSVAAVLATVNGEKITFLAVCGKDAVAKGVKAGDIIKAITPICGGKGGGKPDSAMGGGSDVVKLDNALAAVDDFVSQKLGL